ncbi:hypothetical protein GCM10023184_01320 [Flaviaesturariibacter amylovorans]|uniref:Uncharacterized protein n=2 Tax=Flaviaesturariibacter amylovorans TaxID=1084520 RepID=A0ABP8G4Y9_9BACT
MHSTAPAVPPPFPHGPLDSAYVSLRPAVQTFSIDNRKPVRIRAARGTEVLVPAEVFTNAAGEAVAGVQVEVVETLSLPEFVAGGLATHSDGRLLCSNGMVYLNARAAGEPLQLKPGSTLTVSMPTMGAAGRFEMFRGDGKNWTVDSSMTRLDYAVPLPLHLLYPEGNETFLKCISSVGGANEQNFYLDTNIVSVTQPQYEGTVIATDEFRQRIGHLWGMMEQMSYFTNRSYHYSLETGCGHQYNYDIWRVYYDHPERSFRASDSIAKAMYLAYFRANKERIAAFCEEVNRHKRKQFSNWTDTNYYFDFRKHSLEEQFMRPLRDFPVSDKELPRLDPRGVDLAAADAFDRLRAKGVPVAECNELLSYHFRREAILRALQQERDAAGNRERMEQVYGSTVFATSQMGWINCDRFYDDPAAGKASIYVTSSPGTALDYIDYSLVIPALNVRLSAFIDSAGRWSFTRKEGAYTKLPIGQEAVITGVAVQRDSVYFASRKIRIQDGLTVALPMKQLHRNDLNRALTEALKP